MLNRVFIFSTNQDKVVDCLKKVQIALLRKGAFDFYFSTFSRFDDLEQSCKNAKDSGDFALVLCQNEMLDLLVEKLNAEGDSFSLFEEVGIKLEREDSLRMVFLPVESNFENLLTFLQSNQVFCCQIFGKLTSFVEQRFESFKNSDQLDFKILSLNDYLHTVFYSKYIDVFRLKQEFAESLFSTCDQTLTECLVENLGEKTLSVAEFATQNQLLQKLSPVVDLKDFCLLNKNSDFDKFDLDQQDRQNGIVSKEVGFKLAKKMLALSGSDVTLVVLQGDANEKSFVAVGNNQEIHIFSSVFYGDEKNRTANLIDFACFRLICFLGNKQ